MVSDDCRTVSAAAGPVRTGRSRQYAVGGGTCQDIMTVWCIAPAIDHSRGLAKRILFAELVILTMQIIDILGYHDTFGIVPGTRTNSVARILSAC